MRENLLKKHKVVESRENMRKLRSLKKFGKQVRFGDRYSSIDCKGQESGGDEPVLFIYRNIAKCNGNSRLACSNNYRLQVWS